MSEETNSHPGGGESRNEQREGKYMKPELSE